MEKTGQLSPENKGCDSSISQYEKEKEGVAETVTSRFQRIKWDNLRIAQELVGMRRKKATLREKFQAMQSTLEMRPLHFSFGESVWKNSEKYPHSIPMNIFIQDFQKYLKDRTGFSNSRLQSANVIQLQSLQMPSSKQKIEPFSFCMVGDWSKAIRNYLKDIGWQERFTSAQERKLLVQALQRPTSESVVKATRLFGNQGVDFIWAAGYINWGSIHPSVVVSKIPSSSSYFSKISLSSSLKSMVPFIYKIDEVDVAIPRTFEIRVDKDMKHYAKHFRINASISMLKIFVLFMNEKNEKIFRVEGTVPLECVDFAVKRVEELIRFHEHEDLDDWCFSVVTDKEWEFFLSQFYSIAHDDAMFQANNTAINPYDLLTCCKKLLNRLQKYIPEEAYEGKKNLWICKPANGCCGRGVKILRTLDEIKNYCQPNNHYVIQKYIEEPLLIYNTKFDIRQWFLITSIEPLVIWMYDECYLRFCSQEFSLTQLHEAGHLSNNTVQWKYKNGRRDPKLPKENMWDNNTFIEYLRYDLKVTSWPSIKEQMRQAIIASCIACRDKLIDRINSFQLYGADFMVTPDFRVWLIEINCQPSMKYSTSVTTRMCKSVMEDTIKVGLERKINPSIPVGKFCRIYQQPTLPIRQSNLKLRFGLEARAVKLISMECEITRGPEKEPKKDQNTSISCKPIASYKDQSNLFKHLVKSAHLPLEPGDTASNPVVSNEMQDLTEIEGMKIISGLNDSVKCNSEQISTNDNKTHIKTMKIKKNDKSHHDMAGENVLNQSVADNSQINKKWDYQSHGRAITSDVTVDEQFIQKNTNGKFSNQRLIRSPQKMSKKQHEKISSDVAEVFLKRDVKKVSDSGGNKTKNSKKINEKLVLNNEEKQNKRKKGSKIHINSKQIKTSERGSVHQARLQEGPEKILKHTFGDHMFQNPVEMGKQINSDINDILNSGIYSRMKKFEYLIGENNNN